MTRLQKSDQLVDKSGSIIPKMDPNFCVVYIGGRRVVCRRPMLAFLLPC